MVTVDINFYSPHVIFVIVLIISLYLSSRYGDSEKKTAWMFFLPIIPIVGYVIYWVVKIIGFIIDKIVV